MSPPSTSASPAKPGSRAQQTSPGTGGWGARATAPQGVHLAPTLVLSPLRRESERQVATRHERSKLANRLRDQGLTYRAIADELGMSVAGIHRVLNPKPPKPCRPRSPRKPAAKCRNGHDYSAENTRIDSDGTRRCRICRNASDRAKWQRLTAEHRTPSGDPRRRARKFGVEYEPVNRRHVLDRDGWRCGICKRPIDKTLKHPHPMSPTLDHIVPMAVGGGHTYLNCQAAHFMCNVRKSSTGSGDQLMMIGRLP